MNSNLKWFETFYASLESLQHQKLVINAKPEFKESFLKAIMPTLMTFGRERYDCQAIFHPDKSCTAYLIDKFSR